MSSFRLKNPQGLLAFGLKILGILLLLFGFYYWFFLRPHLAVPKALSDIENLTAIQSLNLVQNRTTLVALTRLDSRSANFATERKQSLEKLAQTNQKGQELAGQKPMPPRLRGPAEDELLSFVNLEFPDEFQKLAAESQAVLTEQEGLIQVLNAFADTTHNLFLYQPALDLGRLDLRTQHGEALSRAITARDALQSISQKLGRGDYPFNLGPLESQLDASQQLLIQLVTHLETENFTEAETAREEFIAQFPNVQETARSLELALLRSKASVSLATRQTNLIKRFNFLLEKINQLQQELE